MPPLYFLASLGLMVLLNRFWPLGQLLHRPWTWLGLLPLLAGFGLALWGNRLFVRRGTTLRPFHESTVLVMEGPFRISRNPMYLSMVLVLIGVALLQGSLSPWVLPPALAVVLTWRFIRHEERMLAERFGPVYQGYRARVRRWL